jgi:hypothetical protein
MCPTSTYPHEHDRARFTSGGRALKPVIWLTPVRFGRLQSGLENRVVMLVCERRLSAKTRQSVAQNACSEAAVRETRWLSTRSSWSECDFGCQPSTERRNRPCRLATRMPYEPVSTVERDPEWEGNRKLSGRQLRLNEARIDDHNAHLSNCRLDRERSRLEHRPAAGLEVRDTSCSEPMYPVLTTRSSVQQLRANKVPW